MGPSRFLPGAIVWGARLVRRLDEGAGEGSGMAEVWLAERLESSGEVVIKALRPEAAEDEPGFIDQAIERFRLEAQVTTQLGSRSRHIVKALDVGQLDETPYLVLEFVHGRSLEAILRDEGRIEPARFAGLLEQLADALGAAHAVNVIHRDVKPANLLIGEELGEPFLWLADFGVVKAKRSTLMVDLPKDTSAAFVVGTPAYASPEQLYQEELDGRSDLWSAAVVAYEALTGSLPFAPTIAGKVTPELTVAICTGVPPPPSTKNPALSPEIDAWFAKALAKERAARFQDAREMAAAFRRTLPTPRPPVPPVRAAARRVLLFAGALALFAIGIALILIALR